MARQNEPNYLTLTDIRAAGIVFPAREESP